LFKKELPLKSDKNLQTRIFHENHFWVSPVIKAKILIDLLDSLFECLLCYRLLESIAYSCPKLKLINYLS